MNRPQTYTVKFRNNIIKTVYPSQTKPYLVKNTIDDYKSRKLFNYSYTHFGDMFSYSRSTEIPVENRMMSDKNLMVLTDLPRVEQYFQNIREISNSNLELSLEYADAFLRSFKSIFDSLETEFQWTQSDYFLVPLKGGGVITELFSNLPQNKVFKIDCKRVPLMESEGAYGFGMHVPSQISAVNLAEADEFMFNNLNGKEVTILELCVASGITTIGFLLDLYYKNLRPKKITILSTVVAQQGYEISQDFAKQMGIELNFITAKVAYILKDHYKNPYDPLSYLNGDLVLKSPYDAFRMIYNTDSLVEA